MSKSMVLASIIYLLLTMPLEWYFLTRYPRVIPETTMLLLAMHDLSMAE